MIAGLEEITSGTISIDGRVVNDLEPRARGCAMVFQNYALYPHMTVADNIGYALKVGGVTKAERHARIAAVAETLGLAGLLERRPAALSGGQRQRVAMGRAMIREPRVFLFDEPLSNLDAKLRVQMRLEIRRLHNRLHATSVFVTHDQVEAMTLADRLVLLRAGCVEQVGTPAEIYEDPASRFVADFIGAPPMNFLDGIVGEDGRVVLPGGAAVAVGAAARMAPGTSVTLGFRPERAALGSGETALPFEAEMTEELGSAQLVHGKLCGQDAILSLPPRSVSAGRLAVVVPGAAWLLFETGHGARVK